MWAENYLGLGESPPSCKHIASLSIFYKRDKKRYQILLLFFWHCVVPLSCVRAGAGADTLQHRLTGNCGVSAAVPFPCTMTPCCTRTCTRSRTCTHTRIQTATRTCTCTHAHTYARFPFLFKQLSDSLCKNCQIRCVKIAFFLRYDHTATPLIRYMCMCMCVRVCVCVCMCVCMCMTARVSACMGINYWHVLQIRHSAGRHPSTARGRQP
jgi:hypothetical protein